MPDPGRFRAEIDSAFTTAGWLADSDVLDELAEHAGATYESARADGLTREEAEQQVRALIAAWAADSSRLGRRPRRRAVVEPPSHGEGGLLGGVAHDVLYGVRLLRRQPGFALIAVLTIALGIGATTSLFSLAYGVLFKPLPWPESDRLVRLTESRQGHEPRVKGTITNATYIAWHAEPSTIEEIGGWRNVATTVVVGGEPARLQTASVTPSLFTVLRARALRGRVFAEEDGPPGGNGRAKDVVILSYGLWQEAFGGRDEAIGSALTVGDRSLTVIGVMPRDFAFPDRATRAWTPFAVLPVIGASGGRGVSIFPALARLGPGVTPAQASAEGTARARGAPDPGLAAVAMFGGNGPAEIVAMPAVDMMTAEVRPALLLLVAAVVLLLATATANVASLQLARATTRRRELAIRAAIGAGMGRLARQLAIENTLIGLAGGTAGLLIAVAVHRVLPALLPAGFPRIDDIAIDGRILLFSVVISVVAGIGCGLMPMVQARRLNVTDTLSDTAPAAGYLRSPTARARTIIMTAQIAVACVLLIGAALLGRSFFALISSDRGYEPRNVLTARIPLPASFSMSRRTGLLNGLVARLREIPGVSAVGFGNALPLLSAGGFRAFKMRPPVDPTTEVDVNALQRVVSAGYFHALGLRLAAGRTFTDDDSVTSREVIVVNRSFAAKYLGDRALGAIVPNLGMCREDDDRWEVVGIVDDMRQGDIADAAQPEIFMPFAQIGCANAVSDPIVVVRTEDDPSAHAATLRTLVRQQEPSLAIDSVMTMEERVLTSLARPRLYALVLAGFAVFALAIAGVGLFGVLSYSVAERSREIGVRTALGARPSDIVSLVMRQVLLIAGCGIAAGAWAAFALSRSLSKVLYGIDPHDPAIFVAVPVVLVVASAVACVVPTRRAARVDPVQVLRAG